MPHQFKIRILEKVSDIFLGSREEIVNANDIVPTFDQFIT